eukprot:COSAG06_NODE_9673_length_1846_cov_8.878077_1_plen_163_part_10
MRSEAQGSYVRRTQLRCEITSRYDSGDCAIQVTWHVKDGSIVPVENERVSQRSRQRQKSWHGKWIPNRRCERSIDYGIQTARPYIQTTRSYIQTAAARSSGALEFLDRLGPRLHDGLHGRKRTVAIAGEKTELTADWLEDLTAVISRKEDIVLTNIRRLTNDR